MNNYQRMAREADRFVYVSLYLDSRDCLVERWEIKSNAEPLAAQAREEAAWERTIAVLIWEPDGALVYNQRGDFFHMLGDSENRSDWRMYIETLMQGK